VTPRQVQVLVYRPDDPRPFAELIRARPGVTLHVTSSPDEAARVAPDLDVIFGWKVPPALYEKTTKLAWFQVMGAGVDWVLVPALPRRVVVTRVPGVFGPWMAEYVLTWCGYVVQRIDAYRAAQRERRWLETLPARLGGTTLTIVGLGDIGRTIARAARAAGMRVVGVSRTGAAVAGIDRIYRARDLRHAIAVADWLVLTVPLTPATRGLIGREELAVMKASAWLINIARGAVVDEAALLDALGRRAIGGAVLDVFATEPLPPDHPFWTLDNVVVTPHIAGPDVAEEIVPVFRDNLARFVAGRPLRHVVDRRRGY
jgi:glyoxylate/hydroxypyruvate reductase A